MIISVEAGNFDAEVLESNQPVIVDFFADWCAPCRMLTPVLDTIASQYSGRIKIVKCDVDVNDDVATRYGVRKIPNLTFFKNGQVVDQTVGYMNEVQLSAKVEEVLGS